MIESRRYQRWAIYRGPGGEHAWYQYKVDLYKCRNPPAPPPFGRPYATVMDRQKNPDLDKFFDNDNSYSENIAKLIRATIDDPSSLIGQCDQYLRLVTPLDEEDTRWLIWNPYM